MRRSSLIASQLVWVFVGCSSDSSSAPPKAAEEPVKLAGVYPDNFKCDSIMSIEALTTVLGGPTRQIDSASSVPRGVPHPCNYEVQAQSLEYWTFDIDCRDGYKQRADALFAQYRATSADLVDQYNHLPDAGASSHKGSADAGPPSKAPEAAAEVNVGAKGLDHHGQGVIFIDDDAPCYVRVIGPDGLRRLDLAKQVAKNLTFANAPMSPRPFK